MTRIGILALQGSVIEHKRMLERIEQVQCVEIKKKEQLKDLDGMILPGGESTAIAKLMEDFDISFPLKERIEAGMPVWGTCAGLILLAKHIRGEKAHLGVMNITVRRNAYGRQLDSFETEAVIPKISGNPLPLVFIRAPWIEAAGPEAEVLLCIDNKIVAAQEKNILATSFHPELTTDLSLHRYFVQLCRSVK